MSGYFLANMNEMVIENHTEKNILTQEMDTVNILENAIITGKHDSPYQSLSHFDHLIIILIDHGTNLVEKKQVLIKLRRA